LKAAPPDGPALNWITQLALAVHAPIQYRHAAGTWIPEPAVTLSSGRIMVRAQDPTPKWFTDEHGLEQIDRIVAEWSYTRDELAPFYEAELDRLTAVAAATAAGLLAEARHPDGNPTRLVGETLATTQIRSFGPDGSGLFARYRWTQGGWHELEQLGKVWACKICPHRSLCEQIEVADPDTEKELPAPALATIAAAWARHTTPPPDPEIGPCPVTSLPPGAFITATGRVEYPTPSPVGVA
jgi:hypothetical protein